MSINSKQEILKDPRGTATYNVISDAFIELLRELPFSARTKESITLQALWWETWRRATEDSNESS
jgi:hypothetical protein